MSARTVERILAEWRELERERDETIHSDIQAGIEARIDRLRREYREATKAAGVEEPAVEALPRPRQLRLPWY
jgi:hypothetical protein